MKTDYLGLLQVALFSTMLAACGGGSDSGSGIDGAGAGGSGNGGGGPVGQPVEQPVPADIPVTRVALQTVATGLSGPLHLASPEGDPRLFIVEREGRVRVQKDGALLPVPFLDIRDRTTTEGERGLLSIAFDPQYRTNGSFFLFFTDLRGDIAVERYRVSAGNADVADPTSGTRIISIPHPGFANHYGGLLKFGPDGFLYIGTGDGGGAGDPNGNAQNTSVLLGKLLRLDVSASTFVRPYAIPASNPFANQSGRRGEIWAYGLRNPWRYAFDTTDNLLHVADVGQSAREEVNVVDSTRGGLNYGWRQMEGSLCTGGGTCNTTGLVLPAVEYAHDGPDNACSITGGVVYRGAAIPQLRGTYFYADLCAGWVKGFRYANGVATQPVDFGLDAGTVLSFGEDAQRELYILSSQGNVYRVVAQ